MINLTRTLTTTTVACAFMLAGCDNSSHTHSNGSSTAEANHDDSGHSHGHGGITQDFGVVVIEGSELSVSMSGSVEPNSQLHVDVIHLGGPIPVEIRLWVGMESGEGSLKSKADGNGGHWHGHVECPKSIDAESRLWIEAESTDGTRTAKALSLS